MVVKNEKEPARNPRPSSFSYDSKMKKKKKEKTNLDPHVGLTCLLDHAYPVFHFVDTRRETASR